MNKIINLIHQHWHKEWHTKAKEAFEEFLSSSTRYQKKAADSIAIRSPNIQLDKGVPFTALIHPSNPESGAYGGMSFVLFPGKEYPALIAMVVGTQGLSPDENILGRPGHGRKVQAICDLLNKNYGKHQPVAWAKQDPVRIDNDIPDNIRNMFFKYESVFNRYGKVLYGIFSPLENNKEATELALKAFLDLMFEERRISVLKSSQPDYEDIRTSYFKHLMPYVSTDEVFNLLKKRHFIIIEGPPGTGKTMMAQKMLENKYNGNGKTIQFHPNVTYEQFIGGLSPVKSSEGFGFQFIPKKGFLMSAAEGAMSNRNQDYLLNIDEINRCDLAKVLGEAIYLLEYKTESERELQLPYNFEEPIFDRLKLPSNLHILGTMNTADRSIAIVDVAIRRRFAFVQLWPQMEVVETQGCELMQEAFKKIMNIFIEYASEEAFNLVPGHAYFLEQNEEDAVNSLKINVKPLLEEYLAQGYVSILSDPIRAYIQWINSL